MKQLLCIILLQLLTQSLSAQFGTEHWLLRNCVISIAKNGKVEVTNIDKSITGLNPFAICDENNQMMVCGDFRGIYIGDEFTKLFDYTLGTSYVIQDLEDNSVFHILISKNNRNQSIMYKYTVAISKGSLGIIDVREYPLDNECWFFHANPKPNRNGYWVLMGFKKTSQIVIMSLEHNNIKTETTIDTGIEYFGTIDSKAQKVGEHLYVSNGKNIEILDVDYDKLQIKPLKTLSAISGKYEFSNSGKYMYTLDYATNQITINQYETDALLDDNCTPLQTITVSVQNPSGPIQDIKLGADGNIYIGRSNYNYLDRLVDVESTTPRYEEAYVDLQGGSFTHNFPNYCFAEQWIESKTENCATIISLLNTDSQIVDWDFGDGTHESSGTQISHNYTTNGDYTVKATTSDSNGKESSIARTITVAARPKNPVIIPE